MKIELELDGKIYLVTPAIATKMLRTLMYLSVSPEDCDSLERAGMVEYPHIKAFRSIARQAGELVEESLRVIP